ncbi:MAG: hypothetical protein U0Y82_07915 [Thermoleophilia bacterium]
MADIDPDRIDALLGGATPEDEDERDLLRLAATLREAQPHAPEVLRQRVRGLGEPAARRPRWAGLVSARNAPLAGGVVVAAAAAAVVVSGGLFHGGSPGRPATTVLSGAAGSSGREAAPSQAAPTQMTPGPAKNGPRTVAPSATGTDTFDTQAAAVADVVLGAPAPGWPVSALSRARATVVALGGAVVRVRSASDGTAVRLDALVPVARSAAIRSRLRGGFPGVPAAAAVPSRWRAAPALSARYAGDVAARDAVARPATVLRVMIVR